MAGFKCANEYIWPILYEKLLTKIAYFRLIINRRFKSRAKNKMYRGEWLAVKRPLPHEYFIKLSDAVEGFWWPFQIFSLDYSMFIHCKSTLYSECSPSASAVCHSWDKPPSQMWNSVNLTQHTHKSIGDRVNHSPTLPINKWVRTQFARVHAIPVAALTAALGHASTWVTTTTRSVHRPLWSDDSTEDKEFATLGDKIREKIAKMAFRWKNMQFLGAQKMQSFWRFSVQFFEIGLGFVCFEITRFAWHNMTSGVNVSVQLGMYVLSHPKQQCSGNMWQNKDHQKLFAMNLIWFYRILLSVFSQIGGNWYDSARAVTRNWMLYTTITHGWYNFRLRRYRKSAHENASMLMRMACETTALVIGNKFIPISIDIFHLHVCLWQMNKFRNCMPRAPKSWDIRIILEIAFAGTHNPQIKCHHSNWIHPWFLFIKIRYVIRELHSNIEHYMVVECLKSTPKPFVHYGVEKFMRLRLLYWMGQIPSSDCWLFVLSKTCLASKTFGDVVAAHENGNARTGDKHNNLHSVFMWYAAFDIWKVIRCFFVCGLAAYTAKHA